MVPTMRSGVCATAARSGGRATRSTSVKRSSASQSVSLRTTTAACEPTTARSSLASSLMAATVCANPSAKPVDLWTTRRRVAHSVHRHNNSSRPEQNEKCVTHVPGQNCYPCPRLLRVRGKRLSIAWFPLTRLASRRQRSARKSTSPRWGEVNLWHTSSPLRLPRLLHFLCPEMDATHDQADTNPHEWLRAGHHRLQPRAQAHGRSAAGPIRRRRRRQVCLEHHGLRLSG